MAFSVNLRTFHVEPFHNVDKRGKEKTQSVLFIENFFFDKKNIDR